MTEREKLLLLLLTEINSKMCTNQEYMKSGLYLKVRIELNKTA